MSSSPAGAPPPRFPGFVAPAPDWRRASSDGGGPFTTQVTWRLPEGGEATWDSRSARKRGVIAVSGASGASETLPPTRRVALRLIRINWVAALAFTIGGSLFATGAAVAQLGSGDATTAASIYFAGGLFFNLGGYASLLSAINAPRRVGEDGLTTGRWRWWSYEPDRIDWVSTFILFTGTLAFGVSLLDSFLNGLTTQQENRLIWAPEIVGCTMFLVSGHLAMTEFSHRFRPVFRPRELAWWIVAVNQVGSILFMVSALAAFVRPETSSEVNVAIANWGTLTGAACFAAGGVLQAFDRPAPPGK